MPRTVGGVLGDEVVKDVGKDLIMRRIESENNTATKYRDVALGHPKDYKRTF